MMQIAPVCLLINGSAEYFHHPQPSLKVTG
jgi:hypothetical protein